MKYLALLLIFGFGISGFGQTIKSLGYNTTNGQVVAATAELKFTNETRFGDLRLNNANGVIFIPDLDGAKDIFYFDNDAVDVPRARVNLGLGWSALTNTNAATSLLGFTTNGEVVANTGTNALTFTNRFRQSSTNATNPPEIRLTTKSNNVASWFVYDAFGAGGANTTNDIDWSVLWLGNNHVPSSSGLDFGRADQSIGAISLTMENMYYAGSLPSPSHVGEFYINISDYTTNGSGTTRAMFVVGSQTNSARGQVSFAYPIYLNYNQEAVDWLSTGSGLGGLNVGTTNSFQLATFYNTGTAHGGAARISIGAPANAMGIEAGPNYGYIRQFSAGRTAFRISTNGVIYGTTNNSDAPQAPVHLAGNTRIDGAISFNNTTNAAITRTNLELGATNTVTFRRLIVDPNASGALGFQYGTNDSGLYNGGTYNQLSLRVGGVNALTVETNGVTFASPAAVRTNLGLGWPALTNTSNAGFRTAIGVAPAPIFKVLTNDFNITNQTNMTVVDGLTITTEAGKNYICELLPILSANSGNTVMQIVGSNATVYGNWLGQNVAVISTNSLTNEFSVAITSARAFFQKFHVITGTNSGSISFQFRNATNNNTNTIGAGSYMMAQEILVTP